MGGTQGSILNVANQEQEMDQDIQDYLFDLQGYLVLENAISAEDLDEMNQWIDDHEAYVEEPWTRQCESP